MAVVALGVAVNYDIVRNFVPFSGADVTTSPLVKAGGLAGGPQPEAETVTATTQPEYETGVTPLPIPDETVYEAAEPPPFTPETSPLALTFKINQDIKGTVLSGNVLSVKRGDKIEILSADSGEIPSNALTVNMLGFVGDKNNNTGEDRGIYF